MTTPYLWNTYETIPAGVGFPIFGACHLFWLAFAALVCAGAGLIYRRADAARRRRIRLALAVFMLLTEIIKQSILIYIGGWLPSYLPLHLCSINIFLCLYHGLHPAPDTDSRSMRFVKEFLYAVCLPGAILALLFPGWTELPFGNFLCMDSFVIHILLVLYPLLPLAVGELRPSARRLPLVFLALLVAAPPIYFLDKATGANFFFLNFPGSGNPLSLFETWWGNPGYIAGFPIIMAVLWTGMYLPWYRRQLRT